MGNYTPTEIIRVCELRESGKTYGQIEPITGMKAGSVVSYCVRNAAIPSRPLHPAGKSLPHTRNGKPVRPFTDDEDQQIRTMRLAGARKFEIAQALNRPPSSISNRLVALAYADAKAEVL
jgi:hypothetical protein